MEILGSLTNIETKIQKINGTVGVAAVDFKTGKSISLNHNEIFFTASVFKIPLLITLYKQVDTNSLDLEKRVTLSQEIKTGGSGVLRELMPGIQPSLLDLAMLMIIVSDNTATDILYNIIGAKRINALMKDYNLPKTLTPMSCKQLLSSLVGIEPPKEATFKDIERIDGHYIPPKNCSALDENKSNVSTPSEMVELMRLLATGNILSTASTEDVLSILKSQRLKTIIPHYLPKTTQIAHKTGGVYSVRCDVGIVWGSKGPYSIAIMAKNIIDEPDIDNKLAELSLLVYGQMTS